MAEVLWIYSDPDPLNSGELRRLGVAALAMDIEGWSCQISTPSEAGRYTGVDVAVIALAGSEAISRLSPATKIIIEVDTGTALTYPEASAILRGLANRIVGVVARGVRAATWASQILESAAPVWLIPDPAVRAVEITAAAVELGLPAPPDQIPAFDDGLDLWFCEPGDHIGPDEVEALVKLWSGEGSGRLVVAPPLICDWLRLAGVKADMALWSPATLHAALSKAERCRFLGAENYVQARRRVLALRSGATAVPPTSPAAGVFDPLQVVTGWEEVLSSSLTGPRRDAPREPVRVMVLLDLIQDLDPSLPLLDELRTRAGVEIQLVVSSWVIRHSPRTAIELRDRGLSWTICDRASIISGAQPPLGGTDAVLVVAESSLNAHACSHALVNRARRERIPTFALQHGVENVALHHVAGEEDAAVAADHLFVWFPADRLPEVLSVALRPRLVHVGRAVVPHPDLADINGAFAAFDSIVAVFENLHWSRYKPDWRARFLADCTEFALSDPTRAVILKPHHAGLWSVKNRHLIPQWPSNLIVADPTDAFWEPYTATALVQLADMVITTPSTVALDAVQAGKPVAVTAYGLELPVFSPLPMIERAEDWATFCATAGSVEDARRRAVFLGRTARGERAAGAAIDYLIAAAIERRRFRLASPQHERVSA